REEASGGRSVRREGEGVGRRGGGSGRSGLSWGGGRRWEGVHREAWGEVRPGAGGGRKVPPEEARPGPGGGRKGRRGARRGGERGGARGAGEGWGGGGGLRGEGGWGRGGGVLVAHRPEGDRVVRSPHHVFVEGPPWEAVPRGGGVPHRAGPGRHREVVRQGCDEAGWCGC